MFASAFLRNGCSAQVRGFSLLELMLVLLIIGLMAVTTTLLTTGVDDQAKYDDTQRRLAMIKRAIVGDATRTINGEPEISGFVADMGRLPACIRELVDGKCVDSDPTPPLWALDVASGLWAGWRGPYLDAGTSSVFRDGWGNKNVLASIDPTATEAEIADEDARNFGWQFSGMLSVVSLGKDGAPDGLDKDYTADMTMDISATEHQVDLASWDVISVEFNNVGSAPITIPANSLQLLLHTQIESENFYLSLPFPPSNTTVPAAFAVTLPVSSGDKIKLPGTSTAEGTVTKVIINTDGVLKKDVGTGYVDIFSMVGCPCVIELPVNTTLSGDELTVATAGVLTLPPWTNIVPSKVNIPVNGLAKHVVTAPPGSDWDASNWRLNLPSGATVTFPTDSEWDNNKVFSATPTINVSESFSLNSTQVTTSSGDVFFVPSGSTNAANTITLAANLPLPVGVSALSVVCASNKAIYTGDDCSTADPSAAYDATYKIKLAPRQAAPLKPNPLIWTIE